MGMGEQKLYYSKSRLNVFKGKLGMLYLKSRLNKIIRNVLFLAKHYFFIFFYALMNLCSQYFFKNLGFHSSKLLL